MGLINKPATATEQPSQNQQLSESGDVTYSRSFKDTYANCKTWLDSLSNGDTLDGCVLKSASLMRTPGDHGIVTLNLAPNDIVGPQGSTEQVALDETWTLKAVRNDMSLLAYCGTAESTEPNRAQVEAWLKEPDGDVAAEFKFTKSDGSHVQMTAPSQTLAEKFMKGHDSVMRFYPMLTKRRTYSTEPEAVYENLARIDTPTVSSIYEPPSGNAGGNGNAQAQSSNTPKAKKVKKPGNISSIISGHSWLKCQDDCEQTSDGKFVRIESWIGAKTGESSWDENFYGGDAVRWPVPYSNA